MQTRLTNFAVVKKPGPNKTAKLHEGSHQPSNVRTAKKQKTETATFKRREELTRVHPEEAGDPEIGEHTVQDAAANEEEDGSLENGTSLEHPESPGALPWGLDINIAETDDEFDNTSDSLLLSAHGSWEGRCTLMSLREVSEGSSGPKWVCEVSIKGTDGAIGGPFTFSLDLLRQRCPQAVLDFYEKSWDSQKNAVITE